MIMVMHVVGLTLPSHNHNSTFIFRSTTTTTTTTITTSLKPIAAATRSNTQQLDLKTHLSNLDNLLQNHKHQYHHPVPVPVPVPVPDPDDDHKKSKNNSIIKGKGLLECLKLSTIIWPQLKKPSAASDDDDHHHHEMSPRHLNKLQRLLSNSSIDQYSPRNILGARWREYHGSNDWSGLLDPLDENLRREVVRYGEFIQAAYRCFNSNPGMSSDKPPLPNQHVIQLPDSSYKVTKSLYATSSVGFPKWVDDVAPDLGWMTQRSSWIGYVAVCEDMNEIHRMGRRDIVIALRGTSTCLEWGENFRDMLVPIDNKSNNKKTKVECGFSSLYKTQGAHVGSLSESVVEEVQRLIEEYKGETLSITVTGHSLGAALALLVADEVSTCVRNPPPVAVFSFGGPRVGNRSFGNELKKKNVKVLRVVNNQDVITRVPGMFVSEELDKKLNDKVVNVLDEKMPWAYSHVGTELRVDTRMSPYLKPNADVACRHDLEAYLHLVDGFIATNSPFRPSANRSLWKLVNEQKSNMNNKILYLPARPRQQQQQQQHLGLMPFNLDHHALPSPS